MNAIVHRQIMNEDVAGFFTQIGELYVVHHLWGKESQPMITGLLLRISVSV